jgi:hypothetical protein
MPDSSKSEPEIAFLPDVVLNGWAVHSHRTSGQDGVEHAIVLLTLQFQPAPGHSARQTFILGKDDAKAFRADLKSPAPIQTPSQENQES